jgi:tetratricopeptide (TPR) repeat protein
MVLSSYLFLIHVPYYYHIHNLFLQVGIEQGLPGIIGLTGMFIASFWSLMLALRRAHAYLALCAALVLASLLSLFIAGLFESDVYAGGWIVSMFLPFGFAWLIGQHDVGLHARRRTGSRLRRSDILVGLLPVVAVLTLLVWPGSDAQWLANRAALEQTRIELSHFRFPLVKIQDEVRRNPQVDLTPAIQLYRAALERNPTNVTALRRLAQIDIARGAYASAQQKLETAWQIAPEQRATRQMLGEVYLALGEVDQGRALWATVENGADQLGARVWWHRYIGDEAVAQRMEAVLAQLKAEQE